jgi:hypothetical protein
LARNCQRVDGDGTVRSEDKRVDVDLLPDHLRQALEAINHAS